MGEAETDTDERGGQTGKEKSESKKKEMSYEERQKINNQKTESSEKRYIAILKEMIPAMPNEMNTQLLKDTILLILDNGNFDALSYTIDALGGDRDKLRGNEKQLDFLLRKGITYEKILWQLVSMQNCDIDYEGEIEPEFFKVAKTLGVDWKAIMKRFDDEEQEVSKVIKENKSKKK